MSGFPSFQVIAQRDADSGRPTVTLYRVDEKGNEFVANLRQIQWQKFENVLEDQHKQEISDEDLKASVIGFASVLAGQEAAV